jgi:poly-gamma-glutamate synthesis protein (capsule biosynthesis protein)
MSNMIKELHDQGYVVITTFQWHESANRSPYPDALQYIRFRSVADAGADIVSGSQAHFPQIMEFHNDSFIHFGLGNLFFDNMENTWIRREFMDRYVIYDNKYISTEILTNMLEDSSRPRPMTPEERADFLLDYFTKSGWLNEAPPVVPQPTVTLTPLSIPKPGSLNNPTIATPTMKP